MNGLSARRGWLVLGYFAALAALGCKSGGDSGNAANPAQSAQAPAPTASASDSQQVRAGLREKHGAAPYVGSESCRECHAEAFRTWQGSHHQLAIQKPTETAVLADFANAQYRYYGEVARFRKKDGKFEVESEGLFREGDELIRGRRWFEVKYAFGVYPLQQYLVDTGKGHLQTLPFSYDTRPKADGGQRWYHIYPDEHIKLGDPLHWSAPIQNWNAVCADCHSTDLQRNFDRTTQSYKTSYSEISVGCEACHGPGANHIAQAKAAPLGKFDELKGFARNFSTQAERNWVFRDGKPIAQLVAGPKDPAASAADADRLQRTSADQLSACAKCHALRGDLGGDSLDFDQRYRLELLSDPMYFADGQIREEVYEHGSFLQSKMHARGVVCSDCHEPHSATLRAQGNAVCGRCHSGAVFDTPAHHFHPAGGAPAQCVSCHMPSRVYMGVDDRRDHRFGLPRPDLTLELGVPNACTTACHNKEEAKQAAQWAKAEIEKRFGPKRPPTFAHALDAARRVAPSAERLLKEVVTEQDYPAIARATALLELGNYPNIHRAALQPFAADPSPLVRRALAQITAGFPEPQRAQVLRPLLDDSVRSVRLEAVRGLLDSPKAGFSSAQQARFVAVKDELRQSLLSNADQPGALLDLARLRLLEAGGGPSSPRADAEAEKLFREALVVDPAFTGAYINFADYYRAIGRDDQAEVLLKTGIGRAGDPAQLEHALGLALVRLDQEQAALVHLRRAHELRPELSRFGFVYAVALFDQQKQKEAIAVLEKVHALFEGDLQVLDALIQYQRAAGSSERAAVLSEKMQRLRQRH